MSDHPPTYLPVAALAPSTPLSDKHEQFVQALLSNGGHLVDAYRAVYPNAGSQAAAYANACRLRSRQDVRERLDELTRLAAQHAVIDRAVLLQELHQLATCDASEISRVVTEPCGQCWEDAMVMAMAIDKAAAEGIDLDLQAPRSGCPGCRGRGVQRVHITDTDKLSGAARRLYQGAKTKPDGSIEVITIDQLAARRELHDLLGLKINRSQSVVAHVHIPPMRDMTPAEIADLIHAQKAIP